MSSPELRTWSIRRRLGGSLAIAIGSVLVLLFVALDYGIDRDIYAQLDRILNHQARNIQAALQTNPPAEVERLHPEYRSPGHHDYFSVYASDGRLLFTSGNSRGKPLPLPSPPQEALHYNLALPDGKAGRGLAIPVSANAAHPDLWLVVGTDRAEWDATERRIHSILMGAIALTIAIVVMLALLVVRRTFEPLMREGARIAHLDAYTPPQRLGGELPRELSPFANAFNTGIRRLYEAIERERRFSQDIAHELRTPLAEIRASAEAALQTEDSAQLRAGLGDAIASSERMQRSVDTLLALARYESGQERPALDPLDLVALAKVHIEQVRHLAAQRGICLQLQAPAQAWVHNDIGILERILANLLQNAVEYAPPGSRVDCRLFDEDGHWQIRVCNDAPELEPGDVPRFGTRFWRKQDEGGTPHHAGLGLALATTLAQTLGLELRFSLENGRLQACLGRFAHL